MYSVLQRLYRQYNAKEKWKQERNCLQNRTRGGRGMDLSKVKTSELVAELETREGVKMVIAGPYQKGEVSVEGPAVILVVMD